MKLLYYSTEQGNFGDDLNTWLWDALLPGWQDWAPDVSLVGVGTILKRGFIPDGRKLVLGSGVGYGTQPDISDTANWDIRAVRGPRTAAALRLPAETAIVDPAAMLPLLPEFADIPRSDEIVFVPHYLTVPHYDWDAICNQAGIAWQTPSADAKTVIRRLAGAKAIIAESMHAAIIGDAFGTPWRGVQITSGFNHFKWGDWAESLGAPEPEITEFFAPLRKLQGMLRQMRSKRRPAPTAAAPAPAATTAAASHQDSGARRLGPLLAPWAVRYLKAEARGPFALTDRERLAQAQGRYQKMLEGVQADYAGPAASTA